MIAGWLIKEGGTWLITEKGIDEKYANELKFAQEEQAELPNVKLAYQQPFTQKDDLDLARENHSNVILELQKIKENIGYVSEWQPMELGLYKAQKASIVSQSEQVRSFNDKVGIAGAPSFE